MDDLLDLDFATRPSNPPAKASAQSAYANRTAFDYLAQQSAHRTPSPSFGTALQPSRTPTPRSQTPAVTASKTSGGDAFGDLFGTSPEVGRQNGDKGLSMAERLQRENAAKIGGYGGLSGAGAGGAAFAGLGSLASSGGSRAGSPALKPPPRGASPASSLLSPTSASSRPLSPSSASSSLSSGPAKPTEAWNFDLLASSVPASKPATARNDDPFDLGFDSLPASSSAPPAKPTTNGRAPPVDDFDLLDAFATPATSIASRPSSTPSPAPAPSARPSPPRSASPPPHILGHLVEMGFSPSAARSALASTANPSTGEFDVDRAVDVLMGGSGAATPAAPPRHQEELLDERERRRREKQKRDEDEWGEEDNVKIGRRRSWEYEGDHTERNERERIERRRRADAAAEQRPATSSAPSAARPSRSRETASPAGGSAAVDPSDPAVQLQQQATNALASAQKFGFSMMKSANTFFGQAREAALKAVEEQRAAARAKAGLPPTAGAGTAAGEGAVPGKPKWWREGMDEEGAEEPTGMRAKEKARAEEPPASSFKDSDDEGGDPVLQKRPVPRKQQQQQAAAPAVAPAAAEYRSPFRRAKAAPAAAAPSAAPEADLLSGASAPPPSSRSPGPVPSRSPVPSSARASPSPRPAATNYRTRPSVAVSPSALASAIRNKTAGNEHFKLGRFGEASAAYSAALDALPQGWVGRVLLLNNRAQSRLRSGEEKAAVDDCTEGLDILLSVFNPPNLASVDLPSLSTESSSLPSPVTELAGGSSSSVDLKDQLGKVLGRRAKAYEGVEKWASAAADWEAVLKLGDETVVKGAGGRKMVNEGTARCRKMLGGSSSPSSPAPAAAVAAKPRTAAPARPRPSPIPVEGSGEAVRALQASRAAADAEDDARHALKDAVDAKILAWKGGKEANLRALIASLENVLWPELGWKKMGMHELVTDNGLKVRYVRAIAKVHPDKLNVGNTTVEQRMIAGLVFAALNDAWNSMK
ncbi:hypothetical protein JCM11251_004120 [Rhodosporidiobolus azoricus]